MFGTSIEIFSPHLLRLALSFHWHYGEATNSTKLHSKFKVEINYFYANCTLGSSVGGLFVSFYLCVLVVTEYAYMGANGKLILQTHNWFDILKSMPIVTGSYAVSLLPSSSSCQ